MTRYRSAGAEVITILSRYSSCIERASVDEAFLDITDHVLARMGEMEFRQVQPTDLPATHVAGHEGASMLVTTEHQTEERVRKTEQAVQASLTVQLDTRTTAAGGDVYHDHVNNPDSGAEYCEEEEWVSGLANEVEEHSPPQLSSCAERREEQGIGENKEEPSGSEQPSCEEEKVKEGSRVSKLHGWLEGEGNGEELSLAVGALMAREMREAVLKETGFTCSAGIAHNKVCHARSICQPASQPSFSPLPVLGAGKASSRNE